MMSTNIGVSEDSATPVGHSLQLAGMGAGAEDFQWQPAAPHPERPISFPIKAFYLRRFLV